jgi:hypothetical protein
MPRPLDLPDDDDDAPRHWWTLPRIALAVAGALSLAAVVFIFVTHRNAPTEERNGGSTTAPTTPSASKPPEYVAENGVGTADGVSVKILRTRPSHQGDDGVCLEILWLAFTRNDARQYPFRPWGSSTAWLEDEHGNTYRPKPTKFDVSAQGNYHGRAEIVQLFDAAGKEHGITVDSGFTRGPITRDKAQWGTLYFDQPVKAATRLTLALPMSAFGGRGELRFPITRRSSEARHRHLRRHPDPCDGTGTTINSGVTTFTHTYSNPGAAQPSVTILATSSATSGAMPVQGATGAAS